jgi:phage gp36-like protein
MSYVTTAQLIARFGEQVLIDLTDRDGLGVIDEDVLASAVAAAEATVNGYVSGRYPIPLSPVTEDVLEAIFNLVRYILDGDNGNDIVINRRNDSIAWLKDVSAGRARLSGIEVVAPPSPATSRIEMRSQPRVFGRDSR